MAQVMPIAVSAVGRGDDCTSPDADGVHVEVSASGYAIVVTSLDGFAPGHHAGVLVDQIGSKDAHWPQAAMDVTAADDAWSLDLRAQGAAGAFVATLEGN